MIFETERLLIRSFHASDLEAAHRLMLRCFDDGRSLEERRSWLAWSELSQEWLPKLHQPNYGDLAVTLQSGGALIGSVGLVPLLDVFGQIPGLGAGVVGGPALPEMGLFWAIDPDWQEQGYASEAAGALVSYAFQQLRLGRLLATTERDNLASQAVMRKLGMRILHNPHPLPEHLQVVGVLENSTYDFPL